MALIPLHPDYKASALAWQTWRDAYAGGRAVKARGITYLPRPAGMKRRGQYEAYRDRAVWYAATARAVQGLTSLVFRRPPEIVAPDRLTAQTRDITLSGVPLALFAEHACLEVLLMGRMGLLVDMPRPTDGAELRTPYWVSYAAEQIVTWHTAMVAGRRVLTLVVLREVMQTPRGVYPSAAFFATTATIQYRVLRLNEAGGYEVSLWRQAPGIRLTDATLVETYVPGRFGEPLTSIPFLFLSPFSLDSDVSPSLLEGLMDVNYRYYRHSADYEHGLHLTALPTPWAAGVDDTTSELLIGSNAAWTFSNPQATVGMLEFQGAGLQPHEKALATDIADMAALGARLLEGQPLVPETATAILSRTQGSESPMQSLISTLSMGMTQALRLQGWWSGVTETVDDPSILVQLNTDLGVSTLEPQALRELVNAWLQGAISYPTLYSNLTKGELTRPGIEADDEAETIALEQTARGLLSVSSGTENA